MIKIQKYFPGLTMRPGKIFCIKVDTHAKFEFWNDPAMTALP
jgi:hypothetical protein